MTKLARIIALAMVLMSMAYRVEAQQLFNYCEIPADQLTVNPNFMAVQTPHLGNDDVTGVTFWIYQEQATSAAVTITYTKGELSRVEGTTDCYLAPLGDDIKRALVLETRYRAASAIRAIDPAKSSAQSAMSNPFILREVAQPIRYAPPDTRVGAK